MIYFSRSIDDNVIMTSQEPVLENGIWKAKTECYMGKYSELIKVKEYSFLIGLTVENSPASIKLVFNTL
ncbi:MAG: hypothetical protein RSE41_00180 [Clostridia bacterium]